MSSGKSGTSFHDKLAKQNNINGELLIRELSKIDENKKSDIRMLETARQRFRSRYKKLRPRINPSDFDAIDVRMYETHNPGFCYDYTGAIKESVAGSSKHLGQDTENSYEVVRRMIFTDGEVDIDKIICLHLLTAHVAKNGDTAVPESKVNSSIPNKGKNLQLPNQNDSFGVEKPDGKKRLTGAWNNLLPCYIIELQRDYDTVNLVDSSDRLTRRHRKISMENSSLLNHENICESNVVKNADMVSNLTNNDRLAPKAMGKMPIISPHVYSLLGASHELRVKRAIAEGHRADKTKTFDGESTVECFRLLDDEDDDKSASKIRPVIDATHWTFKSNSAKMSPMKNNSRITKLGSNSKIDRSITMLKGSSMMHVDEILEIWKTRGDKETPKNDLVTIKPSSNNLETATSKSLFKKSSFRILSNDSTCSVGSLDSSSPNSRFSTMINRNYVYMNSPMKNVSLMTSGLRIVDIHVNNQIQTLVHCVLEVLDKVNPDKLRKIVDKCRDYEKICKIFRRQDVETFLKSLVDQPLVSSPRSFVISKATVVEDVDGGFEGFLDRDLVARSLELPGTTNLEMLVKEIKDNIFLRMNKKIHSTKNEESKLNKLVVGDKRQMNPGYDGITFDHKMDMRQNGNDKSNEKIQMFDEIVEPDGKLVTEIPVKIRNGIMKDSTNKKVDRLENKTASKVVNGLSNAKSQFKAQKFTQEHDCYRDPERVILRRMTNEQRILVGRMCAALKNRRINNEGLIKERTPLAALITPLLSRESIRMLTRGTTFANKTVETNKCVEMEDDRTAARMDRLTGPILAQVRRDVAEHETKRRLDDFYFTK